MTTLTQVVETDRLAMVAAGGWTWQAAALDLLNFEYCLSDNRSHSVREDGWIGRCVRNAAHAGFGIGAPDCRDHAGVSERPPVRVGSGADRPQFRDLDEPPKVGRLSTAEEPSAGQ